MISAQSRVTSFSPVKDSASWTGRLNRYPQRWWKFFTGNAIKGVGSSTLDRNIFRQ
jgi:hypothetical protein